MGTASTGGGAGAAGRGSAPSSSAGPALSDETRADADRIAKPERLLNLVAFLLSSPGAVPFSQIKGRVAGYDDSASPEALEKRFDRDKAELRSIGVPIVYEPLDEHGHEGYRIPREQYFLPEIKLSVEEAAALAVVQRYAQEATGDPLARPLSSAVRKIVVDSPLTGAAAASVTEQHMLGVRTDRSRNPDLGPNLEVLTDAVLRRRPVRFRYYAIGRDEERQREVEPYGLGWNDGHWYLVGRDRTRDDIRHFRVDRIRGRARTASGTFAAPADFDVAKHVDRPAFSLRAGKGGERVDVELRPEIAFMFRDGLREGWTFTDLPGGGAMLSFDANAGEDAMAAVLRFVARQCDRARVVAPPELRKRGGDHLRAMLARYQGPPTELSSLRKPPAKKGRRS
ncbi:MAG: hypothetical protein HMLKMBBP_00059 [Planctomycetes bacterium]|nr:hypothetical protein [Planctomycetota bacterium]